MLSSGVLFLAMTCQSGVIWWLLPLYYSRRE